MKLFRLSAEALFKAADIDDALFRLSEHFRQVTNEDCGGELLVDG